MRLSVCLGFSFTFLITRCAESLRDASDFDPDSTFNETMDSSFRMRRATKSIYHRINVLKKIPQMKSKYRATASGPLPESVDWRLKDPPVLSPVKDQAPCGGCWALVAAAVLESHLVIHGVHNAGEGVPEISAQAFVDCVNKWKGARGTDPSCTEESYRGNDNGCCGGQFFDAWDFAHKEGVVYQHDYDYVGKYSKCKSNLLHDPTTSFKPVAADKYVTIPGSTKAMMAAVAHAGPIAATINGNCLPDPGHYSYKTILSNQNTDCDPGAQNHAIAIVGYGTEGGVPYWIIRNSWGPRWGQRGYGRIKRGSKELGIEVEGGFYPVIGKF